MKIRFRAILPMVLLALMLSSALPAKAGETKSTQKAPRYRLLFFRNDGRVWVVLPPKTTLLEIYPSIGNKWGWVKAYNRHGQILAVDYSFHGHVISSSMAKRPSLKKGKLAVNRHDGMGVAIYTPEDASFIEIINSENGFDGVVSVLNYKKFLLCRQTGLDLQLVNLK